MASASLSGFWKRRLHALPALAAAPAGRGRWFSAFALVLVAVPLALPQPPETASAPAEPPLFRPPRPPADEPAEKRAARAALHKAYALADGQHVKLVLPPFPPEREQWIRVQEGRNTPKVQQLGWVWDERTVDRYFGSYGQDRDDPTSPLLDLVISMLRIRHSEVEGPGRELLDRKIRADLVIRAGSTREQAIEPLTRALRDQAHLPVRMTVRTERRDVWVARGRVKGDPLLGSKRDTPVLIYGKEPPADRNPNAGGWDNLLDLLGVYVGRQVIADDSTSLPSGTMWFCVSRDGSTPLGSEEAVIKRVAEQTGLTFVRERRDVRVLWVEKAE
jgi:hypothetical protein